MEHNYQNQYNYQNLLDRAWDTLPDKLRSAPRFEVPTAKIFVEGNQTIIKNFNEISNKRGREPRHILTFLSKELAAPANIDGNLVIVQRVLRRAIIDKRISDYPKQYVLCHECKRPDPKITELEGQRIIKCEACGAKSSVKSLK